jgi:L-aminopeptidase/D-esterase-like protein
VVGAGTGAQAGALKGGIGTASAVLDDGTIVAALVVANSAGSAVDPRTGELYGVGSGLPGEFPSIEVDAAALDELRAAPRPPALGTATTLAVVATDVVLDKAGCGRLATMGHDGLARAVAPAHTATDGDVVFGLSTATRPTPDLPGLVALHTAAADVVSRAIVHALLAAEGVTTPARTWRSYREIVGS